MNLRDLPDMSAAYKQVQEKNDGNLANNAPPYDKVTRRDVITGRLGKDEMGGKRKKHDCAKKVNYKAEEFDVIPEQHTMLEDGTVTHYDITNGEYIYENVPVEDLEILISEKHEHFDNYDKNAEMLEAMSSYDRNRKRAAQRAADRNAARAAGKTGVVPGVGYVSPRPERETYVDSAGVTRHKSGAKMPKKEAFAFSEEEFEKLDLFGEEIDAMTDEQLIDMMEDIILETAEDDQDLIEICEHLEEVEILSEASDSYYDSAVKSSKDAARKNRMARLKKAAAGAAKKVGAAAKAVAAKAKPAAKAAAKGAVRGAGYASGLAQRAAASAKSEFKKGRERGLKSSGSSKPASSSSSSDDDDTDGKLDSVLSSIRNSKGTSSGGEKKKGPGLLRRAAGAIARGLKKAAGKTARAVSSGSDKLAKRLGEDYEHIAHLYESGLFSMEEIENVIEERYKGKHGQSDKEYADSRSQGGKMVSGDSKQSGAEYTHGRRVKAANPGMQPDVGGKTRPKSQGKMDRGTRADLEYRKANLKKEEIDIILGEEQLDEVLDTPEKANEYARKNVRSMLGAFAKGVANKDISQLKTIEKRKRGAELGKRKAERKAAEEQNEEYVDEAQHARENPEKYEREQAKKSAPVRGEKTPMPPRGDKRREDFEKWYAANVR